MDLNRFNLRSGQIRGRGTFGHNAQWFDLDGFNLGFGDLSALDAVSIATKLKWNEMFITTSESYDWTWEAEHGPVHVNARHLFVLGAIYCVSDYRSGPAVIDALDVNYITTSAAINMIQLARSAAEHYDPEGCDCDDCVKDENAR